MQDIPDEDTIMHKSNVQAERAAGIMIGHLRGWITSVSVESLRCCASNSLFGQNSSCRVAGIGVPEGR